MYRVRRQIGYDMHFFCRENPKNYAVAVVDSGIIRHPDLERQVIAFYDFSNENSTKWTDTFGHGTHVAGCLAGDGQLSNGRYHGICPNAKLVILKVLNKDGEGVVVHEVAVVEQAFIGVVDYRQSFGIRQRHARHVHYILQVLQHVRTFGEQLGVPG